MSSVAVNRTIRHRIGGEETSGASTRTSPVYDPATGEVQAEVVLAEPADVAAAVAAAREAFAEWSQASVSRRAKVMFAFRELLDENVEALARIVSSEHGKVLEDAKGEVSRGLEVVEFACGCPQLLKGEYSDQVSSTVDAFSFRQPLGVCAGITPFNFPAMVPMWMHPLAIACGNAFVLKPSERDPSASNFVAGLYAEAGLPEGVFNVVHGDKVAVDALLDHPDVAAVSFVGSTPIARYVHGRATERGKRVQALGGAKNHAVVMPGADLGYAADQLAAAGFGSAGQRCMAVSVAVAVDEIADPLVEEVAGRAREIKVGPGLDPSSEMGPVVTPQARERIVDYIGKGAEAGARLTVDGRELEVDGGGFWVGPTLIDRVEPEMAVYTDEIFGPVLSVVRSGSLDEAIELINANPYANGAAIFTASGYEARRFQREVEVGMVGINVPIPVPMAFYSFGGWKDSLFGDHHIHGPEGVRFYTRGKA
ncbi:MAG TPA: CoA-acylating methylmalonate-semialdehyde dehydrogenase, partial [Solirubrobacterales bacterium]